MANNCLVTKLQAIVDNDNLPYRGWIKVVISNYNPGGAYKSFISWNNTGGNYVMRILDGTVYKNYSAQNGLTNPYPLNTDIYIESDYIAVRALLEPNSSATILLKPERFWVFNNIVVPMSSDNFISGAAQMAKYSIAAWNVVDFDDLANSLIAVILLEYTSATKISPIEKLMVKKFRYFKSLGLRVYDNQTTGYIPCIRNSQPTFIESQKYITWRGEPFFNKILYFNFDYDNNKINVFDTAEATSTGYSVSHKIAEYSDTTKQWTFLE